jgi:hypothetical protein
MQSYNYAVIGTVMFYLIKPFINYAIVFAFSSALEWKSYWSFSTFADCAFLLLGR